MTVDPAERFALRSGPTWRDPFTAYRRLRDDDPVHHVVPAEKPDADYYVISRYDDVVTAATDPDDYRSGEGLTVTYGELDAIGMRDNPPMVMLDPPAHTDFRKLVARGFTPRQVTELDPVIRAFVRDRLRRADPAADTDLAGLLFKPLPSMVVAHYLGVPESDRARFDRWTEAIVGANPGGDLSAALLGAAEAVTELLAYFADLIDHRRRAPGDDTVSQLVAAGLADDPEQPGGLLSILAFAFTMVAGGNDTTTGLLGGTVALLSSHPDQRAELVDDPGLLPAAIEEFLRLTSPVQGLARTAARDLTLHGTTIPAGRKVLLLYGSANRDERRWGDDAADLDIHRRPQQILTFSKGNHHCLGAAAARLQARVALEELLSAHPDFDVDVERIEYAAGNYVRRPTVVPTRLGG